MRARWVHDKPLPDEAFLGQTVVASRFPWRYWSVSTFQDDSASPWAKLTQSITEGKSYDHVAPAPDGFVTTITQCDKNGWNFSNSLSDKPPLFVREYKNRDEAQAGHKQAVEFLAKGQLHLLGSVAGNTHGAVQSTGKALDCPNCGLINPPMAERCDCGYEFLNKTLVLPSVPKGEVRSSKVAKSLFTIGLAVLILGYVHSVLKFSQGTAYSFVAALVSSACDPRLWGLGLLLYLLYRRFRQQKPRPQRSGSLPPQS